jgi:SdpC family antimicrobial peptide
VIPTRQQSAVLMLGIACLFTFGCTSDRTVAPLVAASPSLSRSQTPEFSGEAAFRGIMFGEGAVGGKLHAVWEGRPLLDRVPSQHHAKAVQFVDSIVDGIKANDASFFARFGVAVQSGDHERVRDAMKEAISKLLADVPISAAALAFDPDATPLSPGLERESQSSSFDGEEEGYVYKQVYLYQLVAVYEYAIAFKYLFFVEAVAAADGPSSPIPTSANRSQLQFDQVVNEVTLSLGR